MKHIPEIKRFALLIGQGEDQNTKRLYGPFESIKSMQDWLESKNATWQEGKYWMEIYNLELPENFNNSTEGCK